MQEKTVTVKLLVPDEMIGEEVELMVEDAFLFIKDAEPNTFIYPNARRIEECEVTSVACDGYVS